MNHSFLYVIGMALLLADCGTAPPDAVLVSGNHACHPSQALPAHKVVPKVPEADISFQAFYNLFVDDRQGRGQDVRDYNALYDECVAPVTSPLP